MAGSMSNIVSTNPFISPSGSNGLINIKTGGSTTPSTGIFKPTTNYTLNGQNYNYAGNPVSGFNTVLNGGTSTVNTNDGINFSGLIPVANAQTNNAGNQSNTNGNGNSSGSSYNPALANTYNNGVNAYGQTLPGYTAPTPFSSATNGLISLGGTQSPQYTQNQINSQNAQTGLIDASRITPTEQNILNQEANLGSTYGVANNNVGAYEPGLTMAQVSGQQGALLNTYNTELQNLQTQEGQAQSQQNLQQQGLNEAGGLANNAAANATSQQSTQQSAYGAAGGLLQPQSYGPTNVPYYPGQGYGTPAANSYGANGLEGAGEATEKYTIGQNVAQLNSSLGGAETIGNNLSTLIGNNNLNPTALTFANGALQLGAQYASNPQYQEFNGQIQDFVASLAPILGAGGNVTDMKTQMSSQIVNALQSGSTIQQVIQYFLNQAQQKIQGMAQGGGAINTNGTSNTNSGGTIFPTSIQ